MKINVLKMQILMGEQNLTIKELACRSNVSRQTISCIKSGKSCSPPFTGRNVPIKEIAQAIGKDPHYIRLAIQQGIFKFGVAMKVGNSNEFSYYCPDRKVWEETGYFRDVRKEKAQA